MGEIKRAGAGEKGNESTRGTAPDVLIPPFSLAFSIFSPFPR